MHVTLDNISSNSSDLGLYPNFFVTFLCSNNTELWKGVVKEIIFNQMTKG